MVCIYTLRKELKQILKLYLIDSTLSFFSLPFFDPIPVSLIQPIKGVSCFSHDIGEEGRIGEDGTVELSVVKRRAIQIYKIGESMHFKKVPPFFLLKKMLFLKPNKQIMNRNYHCQMEHLH